MTTTATKTNALAAAFIAAQTEFPEIPKDSEGGGGNYTYSYASLPAISRVVLPVLHKHHLGITQLFNSGDIVTTLLHENGEQLESRMPCSAEGLDPQKFGAKITYYRRYALTAMLGICPDDDTDAAGVDAPEVPPPSVGSDPPPPPTDEREKTANFHLAVDALIERGTVAIEKVENVNSTLARDEMRSKMLTVLGHEGYEAPHEITAHFARVDFYNALEETVKALEAKAHA